MVIVAAIISAAVSFSVLLYREHRIEPERWKKNAKLETIEKRLEAYGTLLNFLQSSKSRSRHYSKDSENQYLLIIPQDRDNFLGIFQKYRYLFSSKLIETFQQVIDNDTNLYLSPKTQQNDWYQLFDLSAMEQTVQAEFQELQNEHKNLTGYSIK